MPDKSEVTPLILWRAYVPKCAHLPLSGEGAARFGGRWTPRGVPAIYAAREMSTAWAEYNQGFVQHPALIAQLELFDASLADLTSKASLNEFDVSEDIHKCEWRAEMQSGGIPATHKLQALLAGSGFDGVVYPSFMSPGGSCVALWHWSQAEGPTLRIVDPEGRLPKSPGSWSEEASK